MTGADLVYPVVGSLALFICFLAIPLLGLSILRSIGKHE